MSMFLTEHDTGQFRLPMQVPSRWMDAPWLPIVLRMLGDVPCQMFW